MLAEDGIADTVNGGRPILAQDGGGIAAVRGQDHGGEVCALRLCELASPCQHFERGPRWGAVRGDDVRENGRHRGVEESRSQGVEA